MSSRSVMRHRHLALRAVPAFLFSTALLFAGPVRAQTVTTIAGGATCDNASALAASMVPGGSAVDAAGNLYVAALTSHVVCKVAPGGAVSRVAGNGTQGYSGDGGAATSAQLSYPNHVALDGGGNLYIADSGNHRIRKVTPAGIASTIAGTGAPSFGGDGGAATAAQLNFPSGIAFDGSGNLYIADTVNHRIRKITTADGKIATVAGTGTAGYSGDGGAATAAQLNSPYGIALDASGKVYIADRSNHRVRMISGSTITTIAGTGVAGFFGDGGLATDAKLNVPHAVAVDAPGNNVYIADWQNQRIRKITTADGKIATIAGTGTAGYAGDNGPAAAAQFNLPQNLTLDAAGNLYVSDYYNYRVRKIGAADGKIATLAGSGCEGCGGDGGPALSAQLGPYLQVAADAAGNVYISDTNNHRVRKLAVDGTVTAFAGSGIQGYGGDAGPASAAQLNSPNGVALDANGNVYIADTLNNRIRKVATDGTISTVAGNGNFGDGGDGGQATAAALAWPAGVAFDSTGNLYIADSGNNRVRKVTTGGTIGAFAGNGTAGFAGDNGAAGAAQLKQPSGVVVDPAGNLLIADTANNRIRKVTAGGTITTFAGSGAPGWGGDGGPATDAQINIPRGLAIDALGNLIIAQGYDNRVRRVAADGTIDKIAGVGQADFSGDGGPALAARFNQPNSIAFDGAGNLYVADSGNRRIRKVASLYPQTATSLRIEPPASPVYGESVAITVTVSTTYVPTGKVSVCLDGDSDPDFFCWPNFVFPCTDLPLSPGATSGEYVATCTTSTIPVGDHSIAALFSGDALNLRSFNLSPTVTVAKAPTALTVTAIAPGSITLGQSATVTSSLSVSAPGAGTPSGIVTVSDGTVSCSYSTPASDNCSITPTGTGAKTISVSYSGDANFLASTTSSQYLLVNSVPLAGTTTSLALAPNPVAANQAVTATVTVSAAQQPTAAGRTAFAATLPAAVSGNVVVSGGGHQCIATLNGSGAGICTLSFATPGNYVVIASYSGDAQNAPSSNTANLIVTAVSQPAATIPAPMLSWWAMLIIGGALVALTRRAALRS